MVGQRLALAVAVGLLAAGCGGGSGSPAGTRPAVQPAPPDLADFLKLPVATPSRCSSGAVGATVGRVSPWTGHIDISAFLTTSASPHATATLGAMLRSQPLVLRVYHETSRQAHAEFARLYTCSAAVPVSQTPASYRIVLRPGTTTPERNGLVATLVRSPIVDSVSCDPSNPCVSVVRSAKPSVSR